MTKRLNRSMLDGPLLPNIILYTVPIILTNILQLLFNSADLVVVGRFCGSLSVAAVGATGSVCALLIEFFIGFSVGTSVTVAQGLGAQNHDEVHKAVHTALPAAFIFGVFLTIVGVIFCEKFLQLMGTPENVLGLSALYMRIYFLGMTFTLIYNFCASILRATGDTKSPLAFLTIAGVVNVILNVIFVTVFHMNVAGVALATVISQAVSAVLAVLALLNREDSCRLVISDLRIHKEQLIKIIKIGLPTGLQNSLFGISNVIIQSSINSFGDVFMSGSAAAYNIEGFVYASMNGFHQTMLNFTGQNMGAKQYSRVKRLLWICLACVATAGIITGFSSVIFGEELLSIYITDSAQAIADGMICIKYLGIPYFLCGLMEVSTGALCGIDSSFTSMLISVLGVCGIRLVWIFTIFAIPQFHTPECLFFSYTVSWIFSVVVQLIVFFILFKRKTRSEKLI
ncbi:MAG: MATE family efflux transporter [Ruminococcaceae bacterium]|nr:MATE family efflux transporter [Oscillospiraceae bacterium]